MEERRNVTIDQDFDGSWTLAGRFDSAQGAQLSELFDLWVQIEWQADWEKARADHGDNATTDDLPRTGAQRRAETDHVREHSRGGRTRPGNGAPLCGKHNRWKQKGFTVHRNADGTYTIVRPNGSPIPPH